MLLSSLASLHILLVQNNVLAIRIRDLDRGVGKVIVPEVGRDGVGVGRVCNTLALILL